MLFAIIIKETLIIRKIFFVHYFNSLRANPTKWSNTLKQFVSFSLQLY